jgi:hypothetical protein
MAEDLVWVGGFSLLGAVALGLPLRLFGWKVVWGSVVAAWRFTRGHRLKILVILLIGAALGLWSFEAVRELIFGLWT